MAFNIFKKEDQNEGAKQKDSQAPAVKKEKKISASVLETRKNTAKKNSPAAQFLKHAHITEKASKLAEGNQYVFQVIPGANKKEITRAINDYYGVDVEGVNVINVPGKRKRRGKGFAIEQGYRKAIVTVKKGQTIEVLPR